MRDKLLLLLLFLIIPVTLSGCWDVEEINRKSTVDAIFLDAGKAGNVRLGASFNVPGSLLPPYGGTEQQFLKRTFTLVREGSGILDAGRICSRIAPLLFFSAKLWPLLSLKNWRLIRILVITLILWDGPWNFREIPMFWRPGKNRNTLLDLHLKNNMLPGNYIQDYYRSPTRKSLAISVQLWQVFYALSNQTQ